MMPTPPLTPPEKSPDGITKAPPLPPRPSARAPRPLQPRTPNIIAEPEPTAAPPGPSESTDDDDEPVRNPTIPKHLGPRRKCPACLYFPMKPLAQFKDEDIEKSTFGESDLYYQDRPFIHSLPFPGLLLSFTYFLSNLLSAKAKDASNRAKARRAKADILARCPNSLICPECCEVLEIY